MNFDISRYGGKIYETSGDTATNMFNSIFNIGENITKGGNTWLQTQQGVVNSITGIATNLSNTATNLLGSLNPNIIIIGGLAIGAFVLLKK